MKRTINLYSKIKYLTVLFLILIFLLQICIFSNEKFYYHYEVINDGSFENVIEILWILTYTMTLNVFLGVKMYMAHNSKDRDNILKRYIKMSVIGVFNNVIQIVYFIMIMKNRSWEDYSLILESDGYLPYKKLLIQYIVSMGIIVLLIAILVGLIVLSICEIKRISNENEYKYSYENIVQKKSIISIVFCVLNIGLFCLFIFQTGMEGLLSYGISIGMVLLMISKLIMTDKKAKALLVYVFMLYSVWVSCYSNMWYVVWLHHIWIILASVVVAFFAMYTIISFGRKRAKSKKNFLGYVILAFSILAVTIFVVFYSYTERISVIIDAEKEIIIEHAFGSGSVSELDIPEKADIIKFENNLTKNYRGNLYVELELNANDYESVIWELNPRRGHRVTFMEKGYDTKGMMYVSYRQYNDKEYLSYIGDVKNGKFKLILEIKDPKGY